MTLAEICADIRNYFTDDADKHTGNFKISGGVISPSDFLKEGQYFRIIGSLFNDGVYQYPAAGLLDEDFEGAVWGMKIPSDFLMLCERIKEYSESAEAKPSAYTSESFGGYSYSKATNANGTAAGWRQIFADDLSAYRKVRE